MEKKKGGWGEQERGKKQLKTKKKKLKHVQLLHHFFLKGQDFVGRAVDDWTVADALNSRVVSAAMTR